MSRVEPELGRYLSLKTGAKLAAVLLLAGCAQLRPDSSMQQIRNQIQYPTYDYPLAVDSSEIDLPIASLPGDSFWVKPTFGQSKLPNIKLRNLSVTEQGLFDILQIIFADTSYPLSFEGGPDAASRYGVVTVNNLSGSLTEVMNKLGEIMGFFWTVSDSGVVRIMPEQQFVVTMPPILAEDNMAGITNTIQYLGAKDVYLDRINRSVVFRANRSALRSIEGYLDKARESRSLIVYDMNVLQVDLNDSNSMGVRWEQLQQGAGFANAGSGVNGFQGGTVTRGGTGGLDTLILGKNFSASMLVDFLRTQGDVKTLSQPKLGLMNGTNGSIRVGQSTTFVSQVGAQVINGVSQTQADTQELQTGLEVSLTGEVHDATIYSRISVSITELLALRTFQALGIDLNLPEVADLELNTQVRSRPGDTILLGGITVSRSQDDFQNGFAVNTRSDTSKLTELVITIRPKLLNFVQAKDKPESTPVEPKEEPAPASASADKERLDKKLVEAAPQIVEVASKVVEPAPQVVEDTPQLVEAAPTIAEITPPQVVETAPESVEVLPQIIEATPEVVASAVEFSEPSMVRNEQLEPMTLETAPYGRAFEVDLFANESYARFGYRPIALGRRPLAENELVINSLFDEGDSPMHPEHDDPKPSHAIPQEDFELAWKDFMGSLKTIKPSAQVARR